MSTLPNHSFRGDTHELISATVRIAVQPSRSFDDFRKLMTRVDPRRS